MPAWRRHTSCQQDCAVGLPPNLILTYMQVWRSRLAVIELLLQAGASTDIQDAESGWYVQQMPICTQPCLAAVSSPAVRVPALGPSYCFEGSSGLAGQGCKLQCALALCRHGSTGICQMCKPDSSLHAAQSQAAPWGVGQRCTAPCSTGTCRQHPCCCKLALPRWPAITRQALAGRLVKVRLRTEPDRLVSRDRSLSKPPVVSWNGQCAVAGCTHGPVRLGARAACQTECRLSHCQHWSSGSLPPHQLPCLRCCLSHKPDRLAAPC